MVRSLLVLRCSIAKDSYAEQNALHTLIHQRHLMPSCGGHVPTAERTLHPARMFTESLTARPELENDQDPFRTCAVFVPALGSRKDHRTATLRVCFHALQLTKLIERANRNQFEAHEVGLSQR